LAEDILLVHCHTYTEHIDDLRFKRKVIGYLDLPMEMVAEGRDIWDLCSDEQRFPQGKENFCSQILKENILNNYLKRLDKQEIILYYSFTGTEQIQALKTQTRMKEYKVFFPLIDKNISKERCAEIVANEWKINLPWTYTMFKETTCFPCLNRISVDYWATIFKHYPDLFDMAMLKEREMKQTIIPNISLETIKKSIRKGKVLVDENHQNNLPCECEK
jgi:hypothetical protein